MVGEAPGQREVEVGMPFVGPSGQVLERWWGAVGLHRAQLRLENVCEIRPPGNDIKRLSATELDGWIMDCRRRLEACVDAKLIVPLGNTALKAVTGKIGISQWRGSLLDGQFGNKKVWVLPSLHPAAILRQPAWETRCRADWRKAVQINEAVDPQVFLPRRTIGVARTLERARGVCEELSGSGAPFSVDIETPGGHIGCVGVGIDKDVAVTIPTTPAFWGKQAPQAWTIVRDILALPNPKIFQNGHFDTYWLAAKGITVSNWLWDTLAMHHCLDPGDDHALAYMASLATWQPFWKAWDDKENLAKYPSDVEALWQYNGVDCCVTYELFEVFHQQLSQRGRLDFYFRHYAALFQPILSLMHHGVGMDTQRRVKLLRKLLVATTTAEMELRSLTGVELATKTALSSKKILNYLKSIGIKPPRKKQTTGTFGETADEVAIRRLMGRHSKFRPVGVQILAHRHAKKQSEVLNPARFDGDGRMRSSYKFTTDTGRLSSSKNPMGTGTNAQNIDRELREMFVADPGCVLLEADLSQAENRIVNMLTGDGELQKLANTPPWEWDAHTFNASVIFKKPIDQVTKQERFLGKKAIHASNYGMMGKRLSEALINDGFTLAPVECQKMIDAYVHKFPAIAKWQMETRASILRERVLTNSWGRTMTFEHDRLDEEAYRRGYAFVPQSEVIDWLNQYGFLPLWERLERGELGELTKINLHVHDALVVSCKPIDVWDVAAFLDRSLGRSRDIQGSTLRMYVEFKLGKTWKGGHEWKRLPGRDEMTDVALALMG